MKVTITPEDVQEVYREWTCKELRIHNLNISSKKNLEKLYAEYGDELQVEMRRTIEYEGDSCYGWFRLNLFSCDKERPISVDHLDLTIIPAKWTIPELNEHIEEHISGDYNNPSTACGMAVIISALYMKLYGIPFRGAYLSGWQGITGESLAVNYPDNPKGGSNAT